MRKPNFDSQSLPELRSGSHELHTGPSAQDEEVQNQENYTPAKVSQLYYDEQSGLYYTLEPRLTGLGTKRVYLETQLKEMPVDEQNHVFDLGARAAQLRHQKQVRAAERLADDATVLHATTEGTVVEAKHADCNACGAEYGFCIHTNANWKSAPVPRLFPKTKRRKRA